MPGNRKLRSHRYRQSLAAGWAARDTRNCLRCLCLNLMVLNTRVPIAPWLLVSMLVPVVAHDNKVLQFYPICTKSVCL